MIKPTFTLHARIRAQEYGLNYKKLVNNFRYAKETVAPGIARLRNMVFHSGGGKRMSYKWFDGVLYTLCTTNGKRSVMTVTPKPKEEVRFY